MKRKDAVELIGKILVFGLPGLTKEAQVKYKDSSLAEIILSELELAGMEPPKRQMRNGVNEFSWLEWVNKWEPEQ